MILFVFNVLVKSFSILNNSLKSSTASETFSSRDFRMDFMFFSGSITIGSSYQADDVLPNFILIVRLTCSSSHLSLSRKRVYYLIMGIQYPSSGVHLYICSSMSSHFILQIYSCSGTIVQWVTLSSSLNDSYPI